MSHAIIRTSPKGEGQKFIGRCTKCGKEGLHMSAALDDCPADNLVSNQQALVDIIVSHEERPICDCERSHNGLGLAARECDCPRKESMR